MTAIDLTEVGWDARWAETFAPFAADGLEPARVAIEFNHIFRLLTAEGEIQAQHSGRLLHRAAGRGLHSNATTVRSLPLGGERGEFRFELPEHGLEVRDVMRITFHLITMCDDFDPTVPSQAQFFSIIKRES